MVMSKDVNETKQKLVEAERKIEHLKRVLSGQSRTASKMHHMTDFGSY